MAFRQRLLHFLGIRLSVDSALPGCRSFDLDEEVIRAVRELAEREQRPEGEVASALLAFALEHRDAAEENLRNWQTLSAREQQVVAMVCKNFTNQQIAERLFISPETVKSHIRNSARKLGLRTKLELRQALVDWDFSAWSDNDINQPP
jgi:DNA-binding CsgD family transcriptional regulator